MAFGLIKMGPKLQNKVDGGGPASNTCLRDGSNAGRPARPESPSLDNKTARNRHLTDPGGPPNHMGEDLKSTTYGTAREPKVQILEQGLWAGSSLA
jgi:hypothetical protein